jgi:hypothetical protein
MLPDQARYGNIRASNANVNRRRGNETDSRWGKIRNIFGNALRDCLELIFIRIIDVAGAWPCGAGGCVTGLGGHAKGGRRLPCNANRSDTKPENNVVVT